MLDPKNVVSLTGGLVDAPEVTGDVAKLRIAVDFAGNERNSDNKSGYFQVKYFLNSDNPNATFVKNQINNSNFKKGSTLQLVGRLVQERWKDDSGNNRSGIVVIAESITYGATLRRDNNDSAQPSYATANSSNSSSDIPDSF